MTPALPLPKDVHLPAAPALWPLATGWWVLIGLLVLVIVVLALWWRQRTRRRARVLRIFDDAVAAAETPTEQIAAMSNVLRRAARRQRADADVLDGADWLAFLDEGMPQPVFTSGAGALLREGGFRRDVAAAEVEALRQVARDRYRRWMLGR